ncbi:hypothetical protein PR048_007886 [Dryococelus australis]|uniref:Uncharacterized protein n=1 Tax=Dryococelus australis TaxID=614101 RepID=A0ABQ9HWC9_9NEOP|nr:hypothetical protein PR048_007886 [Dryococelus australis]
MVSVPPGRGHDGVVVRLLSSTKGEPGSIPGRVTLPDFRKWESLWTMPMVGGFSRGSPVSLALAFRRCSIIALFHLNKLSRPHKMANFAHRVDVRHATIAEITNHIPCCTCVNPRKPERFRMQLSELFAVRGSGIAACRALTSHLGDPGPHSRRCISIPYFRTWGPYRTVSLVGVFSWGSPASAALAFRHYPMLNSLHPPRLSRLSFSSPISLSLDEIVAYTTNCNRARQQNGVTGEQNGWSAVRQSATQPIVSLPQPAVASHKQRPLPQIEAVQDKLKSYNLGPFRPASTNSQSQHRELGVQQA